MLSLPFNPYPSEVKVPMSFPDPNSYSTALLISPEIAISRLEEEFSLLIIKLSSPSPNSIFELFIT